MVFKRYIYATIMAIIYVQLSILCHKNRKTYSGKIFDQGKTKLSLIQFDRPGCMKLNQFDSIQNQFDRLG